MTVMNSSPADLFRSILADKHGGGGLKVYQKWGYGGRTVAMAGGLAMYQTLVGHEAASASTDLVEPMPPQFLNE